MKILRFQTPDLSPRFGWLFEDQVGQIDGDPFRAYRRLEPEIPVDKVHILAPVLPQKIICVGRNYAAHAKEHGVEMGEIPTLFLKPTSSVIGPGDSIILPPQSKQEFACRSRACCSDQQAWPLDPRIRLLTMYMVTPSPTTSQPRPAAQRCAVDPG